MMHQSNHLVIKRASSAARPFGNIIKCSNSKRDLYNTLLFLLLRGNARRLPVKWLIDGEITSGTVAPPRRTWQLRQLVTQSLTSSSSEYTWLSLAILESSSFSAAVAPLSGEREQRDLLMCWVMSLVHTHDTRHRVSALKSSSFVA